MVRKEKGGENMEKALIVHEHYDGKGKFWTDVTVRRGQRYKLYRHITRSSQTRVRGLASMLIKSGEWHMSISGNALVVQNYKPWRYMEGEQ